jgi:coenzyme F420-dependent glucose-6-phosphate dehydrogenase
MAELTLGWKAGPEQFGPRELIDYALAAEQAGFDLIDMSDHFHPWDPSGACPFTWTVLGAVAARTNRIKLGPGVTCPILRYHPSVIAQASATLEVMAPGRSYLAVGTGEALNEYSAMGEWPSYRKRQDMLGEAIDLIRMLWTGEEVTYDGYFFSTRKARLYTPPETAPPLFVSTMTPDSAGFAGEKGDGLITVGGQTPEVYKGIMNGFDEASARASRGRIVEVQVAFTDDTNAATSAMKQYWAGATIPALFNRKIYTPQESAMNGAVVGQDVLQSKMCISKDPEQHVAFAQRYVDMGFDHLVFHCPMPDQQQFVELYGREVLPLLRDRVQLKAA